LDFEHVELVDLDSVGDLSDGMNDRRMVSPEILPDPMERPFEFEAGDRHEELSEGHHAAIPLSRH